MEDKGSLGESFEAVRAGLLKKRLLGGTRADLSPGTRVFDIDTLALGKDATAKQLYPALWEYVLSRPDAANIPTALSSSNAFRRNSNLAGMYEKHGERANRLVVDPSQFSEAVTESAGPTAKFHRLPLEAQVGALNAAVAQGAGGEVNRVMRGVMDRSRGDASERFGQYLERARRLGIDPEASYRPTTDVEEGHFGALGRLLWEASRDLGSPSLVGESSLRRAAITSDALDGLTAKDLANQRWLTDRLGRRQGGPVWQPAG